MLRKNILSSAGRATRRGQSPLLRAPLSTAARDYQYFDNFEVQDGIAIVRFNGPGKMNTISTGLQKEAEKIFTDKIISNKDVKAVVFISSKPDSFIAGADIDMISTIKDKSELKLLCMQGHVLFKEAKKVPLNIIRGGRSSLLTKQNIITLSTRSLESLLLQLSTV